MEVEGTEEVTQGEGVGDGTNDVEPGVVAPPCRDLAFERTASCLGGIRREKLGGKSWEPLRFWNMLY